MVTCRASDSCLMCDYVHVINVCIIIIIIIIINVLSGTLTCTVPLLLEADR